MAMANQSSPTATVADRLLRTIRRNQIAWLLLGIFIGLIFGWLIWPVAWRDAGMDDLTPEVRAHFVSATADAYVASGGQDPATALVRMRTFSDPQAAVFEAIAFFQVSNDPNRIIREVNLRSLASALGAYAPAPESPAVSQEIGWLEWTLGILAALLLLGGGIWIGFRAWAQQTSAQPSPASDPDFDAQPARVSSPAPVVPSAPAAGSGWQPAAPPDAALGDPTTGQRVIVETWDSEKDAPPFATRTQTPPVRSTPQPQPRPISPSEEPPIQRIAPFQPFQPPQPIFAADEDEEDEEDLTEAEEGDDFDGVDFDFARPTPIETQSTGWISWAPADDPADAGLPAARPSEESRWQGDWTDDDEDGFDGTLVEEWNSDDEIDEEIEDALDGEVHEVEFDRAEIDEQEIDDEEIDSEGTSDDRLSPTVGTLAVRPATKEPVSGWGAIRPPALGTDEEEEGGGFLPTVQGVLSSFRRGEKESSPARSGREIGKFKAEFHVGMLAYEQSFTITSATATDDADGVALGACGVGISERLDTEAAHSEKVRVLDVWLYDGTEVRSYNQYLITPGMDRETLAKQAPSSGTITGEPLEIAPDLTFRIASKNLVLDCRITTAELLNPGTPVSPLRSVRIEMTARTTK